MRSAPLVSLPLALAILLAPHSAGAQTVSPAAQTAYEDRIFDFEGEHYAYRLLSPPKVEPGHVYPLLVFLHGAGERGRDDEASLKYLPDLMAEAPYRQQFPAFVLVPQSRDNQRWVEADWGARQSSPMRPDPSPMMAMAMGLLDKVLHESPVDLNRVYLAGISMGGFGAWELAARMPETFAAVVPVCGGGDERTARLLADTPLWAWHGDADTVVSPGRTRSMIEAIRKVGGSPKYTELRGVGHDSFLQAFAPESGVLRWLFEQHRGPARLDTPSAGTPPLRILAVGDSNTEAREFPGYRGFLKAALDRRGIASDFVGSKRGGSPAGDPEHEGYSAEGLARIRQRIREGMIEQHPADVMLLLAGSNDLWVDVRKDRSAVSPKRVDDLARDAGEIFDAVHERRPSLRLLVGLPATPGNVPDALAHYRDGLKAAVDERRRKGFPIDSVDMAGLPNDGVHYTGEGFEGMARRWADKIAASAMAGAQKPRGSALHPEGVTFSLRSETTPVFGTATVDVRIDRPTALNPFTDVAVTGEVKDASGQVARIDGFCDSADGSRFAVRFMPRIAGPHTWKVTLRQGDFTTSSEGVFHAVPGGGPKGPVRVDKDHPLHFVYEGGADHFFWNSTTTYAMAGWRDEDIIRESLDRLARFKINRVRVALIPPRVKSGAQWMEPAITNNGWFSFCVNPWPAKFPEDVNDPGFDPHSFNVPYWQKYERLVEYARDRGIQVSVIFYVDGSLPGVDPFRAPAMGGDLEKLYYSYAAARLSAYSNVMWDVANEYRHFRDDAWAEKMGAFLREHDPYAHLMSIHGHGDFHFRQSPWADFAMYQSWDEHGAYDFMSANIAQQKQTGRTMPQVNEEYGYEDHYPYPWGEARLWPARTADTRNKLSWQIAMAGGYQTTGERANVPGYGGWITGRGNDEMILPTLQQHLYDFWTAREWWKMEPLKGVGPEGVPCLGVPGVTYVLYLPNGGSIPVRLPEGAFTARWYDRRTGVYQEAGPVRSSDWRSPAAPDNRDWILAIEKN
jgi:poly(3-hydroxybutyrate) depolymerase/lysophospholipase L1-like esterase